MWWWIGIGWFVLGYMAVLFDFKIDCGKVTRGDMLVAIPMSILGYIGFLIVMIKIIVTVLDKRGVREWFNKEVF